MWYCLFRLRINYGEIIAELLTFGIGSPYLCTIVSGRTAGDYFLTLIYFYFLTN